MREPAAGPAEASTADPGLSEDVFSLRLPSLLDQGSETAEDSASFSSRGLASPHSGLAFGGCLWSCQAAHGGKWSP
ncbi:Peroxisomal Acyl-Coenzyme A Oxidase 1 [Manis pentadactyla]|nr:Peroxisomal Acyl-Coenzyme A Oxidase 1 [Manis pentadactyla]